MIRVRGPRKVFSPWEPASVRLILTSDTRLEAGSRIEVQFPNSWLVVTGPSFTRQVQCDNPSADHYITVAAPSVPRARFSVAIEKRHLTFPEGTVRHGRLVTAVLAEGAIPAGAPVEIRYERTMAPYIAGSEEIFVRVNGQAPARPPVLTVRGGPHRTFRVIAPSTLTPGEECEVLIVSLDRFDNLSSTRFRNKKLARSDGAVVAEGISFTGAVRVRAKMREEGVFRFLFGGVRSNPVKVCRDRRRLYWGDIHIHTRLSHDGQGTDPYRYCRQVSGLDFAAAADHWESLGPEGYRILIRWAEEAYEPGRFVTLLSDERNPRELTGHHNAYFLNAEAMRRHRALRTGHQAEPPNSFAFLANADPSSVMLVPHHTGIEFGDLPAAGRGAIRVDACDDRGLRPVVEIYSHHGQSECWNPQHLLAYEVNRMRNPERRANASVPGPHYCQDWWMMGRRFGVIASSDDHAAQGGRRHGGIAAVWAEELTREGVFEAVRHRRCYATTGERILIDFSADGIPMGQSGKRLAGEKVTVSFSVWATEMLLRVEILRFRFGRDARFHTVASVAPRPETMDACLSFEDTVEAPCMYYGRVVQEPLEWPGMAWTSPVWIDTQDAAAVL